MNTSHLFDLYKQSENAFEDERQRLIEDYMSSLPDNKQQQARQFQWNYDGKLRKYKNPLVRAQVAYNMMLQSLNELNDQLKILRGNVVE